MIEINADLIVLAKIKKDGKEYELREIEYQHLEEMRAVDVKDSKALEAATFKILEASGLPQDVARGYPARVLKQLEKVVAGEYETQKK